jgi:cytochrome c-type biogenesis protein
MDSFLVSILSALWLGILTSISPCPLATNIAAMSYIGGRADSSRQVFLSGLLYTTGRMVTYIVLGVLIVASLLSVSEVSLWLQKHMNQFLGPLLILIGMVLLGFIPLPVFGGTVSKKVQRRAQSYGVWGAGLLGIVFALSFCPVSAALFFGSLIPLSVQNGSTVTLPSVYGIGTGLPVFLFAVLIASGARAVGRAFDKLSLVERWVRRITGTIFILLGIYFCLSYIFELI